MLEIDVYGKLQVSARGGSHVVDAVFVFALYPSACILHKDFHAFFAAQDTLIAFFHAEIAGVVARTIITVFLKVMARNLTDVSENV